MHRLCPLASPNAPGSAPETPPGGPLGASRTRKVPRPPRPTAPLRRISGHSAVRSATASASPVKSPAVPQPQPHADIHRVHSPSIPRPAPATPPSRIGAHQTPCAALASRFPSVATASPFQSPRERQVRASASRPSPNPARTAPGSQSPSGGIDHDARLTAGDNRQPESPPFATTNAQSIHKDIHSRSLSSKPGGPAITRDKYSCPQRDAGRRVGIFPDPRLASRKISPFRRNG
jgi:hypothetical protein